MSRHGFTNMDARWLNELADNFNGGLVAITPEEFGELIDRLKIVAQHLQRLDERNQHLESLPSSTGSYEAGYAAAEAKMRRRSNVLQNPEGEDDTGRAILEQIDRRVAQGNVKRYELGERALDDKPDKFNAPLRKKSQPAKPTPAIDLDLDFLSDM